MKGPLTDRNAFQSFIEDLLIFWIEPFIEYGYDSNVSKSAIPLPETCFPCGSIYLRAPRFLPIGLDPGSTIVTGYLWRLLHYLEGSHLGNE